MLALGICLRGYGCPVQFAISLASVTLGFGCEEKDIMSFQPIFDDDPPGYEKILKRVCNIVTPDGLEEMVMDTGVFPSELEVESWRHRSRTMRPLTRDNVSWEDKDWSVASQVVSRIVGRSIFLASRLGEGIPTFVDSYIQGSSLRFIVTTGPFRNGRHEQGLLLGRLDLDTKTGVFSLRELVTRLIAHSVLAAVRSGLVATVGIKTGGVVLVGNFN